MITATYMQTNKLVILCVARNKVLINFIKFSWWYVLTWQQRKFNEKYKLRLFYSNQVTGANTEDVADQICNIFLDATP